VVRWVKRVNIGILFSYPSCLTNYFPFALSPTRRRMALGRDGRSPATLDLNQGVGGKAENRSRLMTPI
jgi:hypothetical protein